MKVLFAIFIALTLVASSYAVCSSYDHNAFYFSMCSSTTTVISSLVVSPSPLVLGENITLSFAAKLGTTITNTTAQSPYSVALKLYKDEVFWVNLCDFVNCAVPDICALLEQKVNPDTCQVLKSHGLPCNCPIAAGSYSASNLNFKTKNPNVSWLTNGEYCAEAVLSNAQGQVISCVEIYAQMSSTEDGRTQVTINQ